MTIITLRAFLFYLILLSMMKLMGKRQIGEMQVSELVTTVLLSELAVFPVTDPDIPFFHGFLPLLLIASLEVIVSFLCLKSKRFRSFLNGDPIMLYEKGKYIDKNLVKARVSKDDVEAQVRINGYADLKTIDKIILERTGKMSVLPKESNTPNQSGE